MASLIKEMLRGTKHHEAHNQSGWMQLAHANDEEEKYILHKVRVCKLARVSHKKKKRLTAEDLKKRIVRENVLMINLDGNWYLDIETGKKYELGGIFGEELENPNAELYVASEKALYYACYDTIKRKDLDPNEELTASELRDICCQQENLVGHEL